MVGTVYDLVDEVILSSGYSRAVLIVLDTYPDMTREDGSENPDYDDTVRLFTVTLGWLREWAARRGWDLNVFRREYTWDDTWDLYGDASAAGEINAEWLEWR